MSPQGYSFIDAKNRGGGTTPTLVFFKKMMGILVLDEQNKGLRQQTFGVNLQTTNILSYISSLDYYK